MSGFLQPRHVAVLLGKLHEPALRGRRHRDGPRVVAREQLLCLALTQDGLEDADQRLGELVLEIVLCVNRDVVLEHVDGVLGVLVVLAAAGALDHDVGDAVAERGRRARIALLHAHGELDVGLSGGVSLVVLGGGGRGIVGGLLLVSVLGERFGDDEVRHVDLVLQQVRHGVLDELLGAVDVAVDEEHAESRLNDCLDQAAVVSTDGLDSLGVHLIVLDGIRPVEAGVTLLVDE